MPRHRRVDEQQREVAGWRASGLSAEAFSARRGYSPKSLLRWAAAAEALTVTRPAEFVRLEIAPRATAASEIVVEVGAARVRVGRGFDPVLLRDVVSALSDAGSR